MQHCDVKFRPLMFLRSYLYRKPSRDPNISDNDHLKHENIFSAKKYQSKNLTKS